MTQREEETSEADITVTIPAQSTRHDIGLVDNGEVVVKWKQQKNVDVMM